MNKLASPTEFGVAKKTFFWAITIALMFVIVEVFSSVALLYRYRLNEGDMPIFLDEPSTFSSVNLLFKIARRSGLVEYNNPLQGEIYQYNKSSLPEPFFVPDRLLGYSAPPGRYIHTYLRRQLPDGDWQAFKTKVTINSDGSRWTGNIPDAQRPVIYVFGDSHVFGSGVNDEQTFSYHLQQAIPEKKVKLFALGGYGLNQAYLRFNDLKTKITQRDTIILGYGNFYDARHVVDPAWLMDLRKWREKYNPDTLLDRNRLPRTLADDTGTIVVDYIEENCSFNNGYCDSPSLSTKEMTQTTVALINDIAKNTEARVYLLHMAGTEDNPVRKMLDKRVELISALSEDFDYFINDDIEGFDPHPGPYWHYAVATKLIERIGN